MVHAVQQICMSLILLGALAVSTTATEAPADAPSAEFFELHIRPVLIKHCVACHDGSDQAESALTLSGREALLTGGDFGPSIVPGNSRQSLLLRAINGTHKELRMPPEGEKPLTKKQIADIAKWIDQGAVWPKNTPLVSVTTSKPKVPKEAGPQGQHWSFQPRQHVTVPEVQDSGWAKSDIDRFVWRKLQEQGLTPVAFADRRTLVRRIYFDLIGLPPSPDQMQAALADQSSDALARLVDQLLESRHYGERWGRHWLDVARYADTQGDPGDYPIPQMYRYRNWVIDALNADMPYDQFIQWQLAGDLLARDAHDDQKRQDMTVATGFLALSRRFGNAKQNDIHLVIEDTLDTLGRGILGVTLRCARCHDHKFDAMTTTDYYGLYGIFASTRYPWMGMSVEKSPSQLVANSSQADAQKLTDAYWNKITRYEYQINNHFRPWLKPTIEKYKQLKKQRDQAKAAGQDLASFEAAIAELLEEHDKFRELLVHGLAWVRKEKTRLAKNPPFEMLFAVSEGDPHNARLHRRGDPKILGDEVPRGFVQALGPRHPAEIKQTSGRVELARWITAPEHPLTARVIVNRVWQQHFGRGLVETASNFGAQGSFPSHPELLDYLVETFIADDWSLKKLHRRILLSSVYQLASDEIAENVENDPDNIYLWKFKRRRLEAEAIRDAMLAVSGRLDRTPGGSHPFPVWHAKRYGLNSPFKAAYPSNRRSVYLMTQRLFKHPVVDLFDGPDRNTSTARRKSTNIASQALFLMNSNFIKELTDAFGKRIEHAANTDEKRIAAAYQWAFARDVEPDELNAATQFLTQYRQRADENDASDQAWAALAKVLLTSNEFFFVD